MNSVVDFFNFVTEGSVCMIVCNILNIDNIDVNSDVIPEDGTERQEMFEDICKSVVQLVWPQIDIKSVQQAAEGDVVKDSDSDDDPQYLDDTVLYWIYQTQDELEETLPNYEDSDDEFGMIQT